ncbi:LysR substrate-binding domain-containing protein, partial [Campylobacter jejuni]|nr:LysR substrate-binding domain-containing protein [Campylobacter jejuni]
PLAAKAMLTPADFRDQDFISLPAGSFNRAAIDRHFPDDARVLSIETPYATTICSMVGKGLGVSIVNPVVPRALGIAELCE